MNAQTIIDTARIYGGVTLGVNGHSDPTAGYVVADPVYTRKASPGYAVGTLKLFLASIPWGPIRYIGVWRDSSGVYWFDVVDILDTRDAAIELGIQRNQISIYDLTNSVEIAIGGNGDV